MTVTDNTLSASQVAEILGIHVTAVQRACGRGLFPGAFRGTRRYDVGQRGGWQIPAEAVEQLPLDRSGRVVWKARRERPGPKTANSYGPRCDLCGIVLERDGIEDENGTVIHEADSPDAGRCWMCKAEYGEAVVQADAEMSQEYHNFRPFFVTNPAP